MEVVKNVNIEFQQGENTQLVFLNGQDVSEIIRTPDVTNQYLLAETSPCS